MIFYSTYTIHKSESHELWSNYKFVSSLCIKGPVPYYKKPRKRMGDAKGCVPDTGIIDIDTNTHLKLNPFMYIKEKKHLEKKL